MQQMLLVVLGTQATIEECTAMLTDIGSACGKSSLRLIVTRDPVRVLSRVEDPGLEVIHLVNPHKLSRYLCAGICEMLAEEMEPLARKPLINIGDPDLRFVGTVFRNRGAIVTETDLKTAAQRRWRELQTFAPTTT